MVKRLTYSHQGLIRVSVGTFQGFSMVRSPCLRRQRTGKDIPQPCGSLISKGCQSLNDRFIGNTAQSPWYDILIGAFNRKNRVSILVDGTYKPYAGRIIKMQGNIVSLQNDYSVEYIMLINIKAVRVYD